MLWGGLGGELEVRASKGGGRVISGSFPYGKTATLSDGGRNGGRPRKERFKPGAFKYSVETSELDIHFLSGHDFGKALASRNSGSLILEDTPEALTFEARLSEEVLSTSHGKDFMAMLSAGLIGGISPGFRLPPPRTVPNAETIEDEDPALGTAIIRTVNEALLFELSAVTRPAYSETQVEARSWELTQLSAPSDINCTHSPRYRWRL